MRHELLNNVKTNTFTARARYLILMVTVCGSCFLLTMLNRTSDYFVLYSDVAEEPSFHQVQNDNINGRFTIKTIGCSIPYLNPLDLNIKKYINYPKNVTPCRNKTVSLLEYDKSNLKIYIRKENFHHYNITDETKVHCCYISFYRPTKVNNILSAYVDERVEYNECVRFNKSIKVKDEFVLATCYANETKEIYKQFYLTAFKKPFVRHNGKSEKVKNKNSYNVLILGIDAVSRLNFYRTMPRTVKFISDYGAVDLAGYNKVGDNTFPNVIPLLLGIKHTELSNTCIPYDKANFDYCPFVWERFKQAGYYTALAEDSSYLGTFNYAKYGFVKKPTDYYIHNFINEAEKKVGYNKDFNSYLCMSDRHFYQVLLNYTKDLTVTMKDHRLFGFFWEITMSHDHLNYPMLMDDSYVNFFKSLESSNYLNDTVIILMSDHGLRWGAFRSTKQGSLEERLPFSFIMLPPSFREKYSKAYNNLKLNSRRLTTPFDVHETLLDLVNFNNIKDTVITAKSSTSYGHKRGISLFLPIPSNRTCTMAGIDDHWCTCHKGTALAKQSADAVTAATHLVTYLNSLMKDYVACAHLKLSEIIEATEMEAGTVEKNEVGWREVMLVVRTTPGEAVLEATLRLGKGTAQWTPVGTVSRLNLYGDQSRCVHDPLIKLYCYCY